MRLSLSVHPLLAPMEITFVHDMLVTPHYYVLLLGPIRFDFAAFLTDYLLGRKSIAECLQYDEQLQTKIMLFPREAGASTTTTLTGRLVVILGGGVAGAGGGGQQWWW